MSRLKLYELTSVDTWWVSSYDEHGVLSLIRDEMETRDFSDVDIEHTLADFDVVELSRCEAESIGIQQRHSGEIKSLWTLFVEERREGVVGTSLDNEPMDMDSVQELNFDADEY